MRIAGDVYAVETRSFAQSGSTRSIQSSPRVDRLCTAASTTPRPGTTSRRAKALAPLHSWIFRSTKNRWYGIRGFVNSLSMSKCLLKRCLKPLSG